MINSIKVTNHHGESLSIDLRSPWEAGLAVMSIDGLGPPKANIAMSELSSADGSVFNSAKVPKRNIVLHFKILDLPTVEDARHILYKYFPIKKKIRLEINTDSRSAYADGYVESNEPTIFSNFEIAQVSILCDFPYFKDSADSITGLNDVIGRFEFPFTNPVGEETLIFGELTLMTDVNVINNGDVETGVIIALRATGDIRGITIYNSRTDQSMVLDDDKIEALTGSKIKAGDAIYINTNVGTKTIVLQRDGIEYNILSCLGRNTQWIYVEPGDNLFSYTATSGAANVVVRVLMNELYAGI